MSPIGSLSIFLATVTLIFSATMSSSHSNRTWPIQSMKNWPTKLPAELNAAELAAWTNVARTILNLHETITRG